MTAVTISARDLAGRLSLHKLARSWRGRCPSCDYAGDVFSVREGKAGRPRLYCANGCSRENLDDVLGRVVAGWKPELRGDDEAKGDAERRAHKQALALRLWDGSACEGLHRAYMTARGLAVLADSPALRFRGDCPHPEGGRLPAMVAAVRDVAGKLVAVHRTYLQRDGGGKAAVTPQKASLGPVWGAAIRLHDVAAEIVVGEGIETSLSAGLLLGLPAWAAINAGNLAKGLVLPAEVRSVIVAADPDPPGETAARDAALRWSTEGRKVRIARPNRFRQDFNDLLCENNDE